MKPTSILLLGALIFAFDATAQRAFTNNVDQARAIKIASRLTVGMREEAVEKILDHSDLKYPIRAGDSFGWTRFYTLADGTALGLEFDSKIPQPPAWTNGTLRAAFIQSNCVNIVSITLTNRP